MDDTPLRRPSALPSILAAAQAADFRMSCDERTGALLNLLVASKPNPRVLELGTGYGAGCAWLLDGMDDGGTLLSVDIVPAGTHVARKHLGIDSRLHLITADADQWLSTYTGEPFDLVFVDCRPGKFHRLSEIIALLTQGGLYVGDDLLPQPTWPDDHQERVDALLASLPIMGLRTITMNWASGLIVGVRR